MLDSFFTGFTKEASRIQSIQRGIKAAIGGGSTKSKAGDIIYKGLKDMPKDLQSGYRSEAMRGGGPDSLATWVLSAAAKPFVGKKNVAKGLWGISRHATHADSVAGRVPHAIMSKMPFGKKLFVQKDIIPHGKKGNFKEVERTSLTAPLSKANAIAAPLITGIALERAAKRLKEKRDAKAGTTQTSGSEA